MLTKSADEKMQKQSKCQFLYRGQHQRLESKQMLPTLRFPQQHLREHPRKEAVSLVFARTGHNSHTLCNDSWCFWMLYSLMLSCPKNLVEMLVDLSETNYPHTKYLLESKCSLKWFTADWTGVLSGKTWVSKFCLFSPIICFLF